MPRLIGGATALTAAGAILVGAVAPSLAGAGAVQPLACQDRPGFAAVECRAAAVGRALGGLPWWAPAPLGRLARVRRDLGRITLLAPAAQRACAAGQTRRALRAVGALRRPARAIARAASFLAPQTIEGDALSGAAAELAAALRVLHDYLARHGCPLLLTVDWPPQRYVSDEPRVRVTVRFAAAAEAATFAAWLNGVPATAAFTSSLSSVGTTAVLEGLAPGRNRIELKVDGRGPRGELVRDREVIWVVVDTDGGLRLGGEIAYKVLPDHDARSVRVVPLRPLRGGETYALVLMRRARAGGRPIERADAFADLAGLPRAGPGPRALYGDDPHEAGSPYPDERLVRADGTIDIPQWFTARALPSAPGFDGARDFLASLDAGTEEHHGFAPSSSVVLHFSEPVDIDSLDSRSLRLWRLAHPGPPGSNLRPFLGALNAAGEVDPRQVAVAVIFPVEDVYGPLARIRAQIVAHAALDPPVPDWSDPDPGDGVRYGLYGPGDQGFSDFFAESVPPEVALVGRGGFLSPDYRENGRFPERYLEGREEPPLVPLDFLLTVPKGPGPFPVVILQHGFGGSNAMVTDLGPALAARGLAAIGINAPEHGSRGNFMDFFDLDDFNAFATNWRQATVDLLALVRLIERLPASGLPLDPTRLGYLGISMGGVIGAVFAGVEPELGPVVLNVAGGHLVQLAGASSSLAEPFLARFAERSGMAARTCELGPSVGEACTTDADCWGFPCRRPRAFQLVLEAAAADWQAQLDPGDGVNFALYARIDPPAGGAPRRILLQEGIGDRIVANQLTEALAAALGLAANRAAASPAGVSALWRYPPPLGHGIFALPEVREQAFEFLAAGGTTVGP